MKYIILGKNISEGIVGNDSEDLAKYFELGWEIVGSRIDFISLLNQNFISEENFTVVTIKDRMFMYQSFFKNVISYEEFLIKNIDKKNIIDWTEQRDFKFLNANYFVDQKTKKYVRFYEDYEKIFNGFVLNQSLKQNENFVVMCIRHRDHCSYRNSDIDFYKNLVDEVKKMVKNVFIVGKGNESFCKNNGCIYLNNLQDYVTLIKDNNCLGLVTQSTGPACLALVCAECPIYILDHSMASDLSGNNAVLGGQCIHFCTGTKNVFYDFSDNTKNSILKSIFI